MSPILLKYEHFILVKSRGSPVYSVKSRGSSVVMLQMIHQFCYNTNISKLAHVDTPPSSYVNTPPVDMPQMIHQFCYNTNISKLAHVDTPPSSYVNHPRRNTSNHRRRAIYHAR